MKIRKFVINQGAKNRPKTPYLITRTMMRKWWYYEIQYEIMSNKLISNFHNIKYIKQHNKVIILPLNVIKFQRKNVKKIQGHD